MQTTVNVTNRTTNWNTVNWRKANGNVKNLRRRIFRATREGNAEIGSEPSKAINEKLLQHTAISKKSNPNEPRQANSRSG